MNWKEFELNSLPAKERLEKLRQRPTPALSECKHLSVEEAMDGVVLRELKRRRDLAIAEDVAREVAALNRGAIVRKPWPMK